MGGWGAGGGGGAGGGRVPTCSTSPMNRSPALRKKGTVRMIMELVRRRTVAPSSGESFCSITAWQAGGRRRGSGQKAWRGRGCARGWVGGRVQASGVRELCQQGVGGSKGVGRWLASCW